LTASLQRNNGDWHTQEFSVPLDGANPCLEVGLQQISRDASPHFIWTARKYLGERMITKPINSMMFAATDSAGRKGLWVTDGSVAGTHELTGISGAYTGGIFGGPTGFSPDIARLLRRSGLRQINAFRRSLF
jgi:hypothetical protein